MKLQGIKKDSRQREMKTNMHVYNEEPPKCSRKQPLPPS